MRNGVFAVVASGLVIACSSSHESFTCAIGELKGTWRISYVETNGNCGAIPDETIVASSASATAAASGCTYAANEISNDKCSMQLDFTCPTTDGAGSSHWVGSMHQVASGRLEGSYTVQLQHPQYGLCRSTYATTMQQQ